MSRFTLTEDTIREGLEQADQRVLKAQVEIEAAHNDREFWQRALSVFETAKARAEGQPAPDPRPPSPKQRGLYEGSAGHQIVFLIHHHDETEMEYDDLVTAMLETQSTNTLRDPLGAIERALKRLVERGFVDRVGQVLTVTEAGLAAARITDGSAPTRGALDGSGKEDPHGTALAK